MKITEPKSEKEFEKYYDLRWRILRKPWDQPKGSEKDELEEKSIHAMALENSEILGVGRAQLNTKEEGQIRYMAVEKNCYSKGIGSAVLGYLETKLKEKEAKYVILNARENAVNFYKKNGYNVVGKSYTLFGSIVHFEMRKDF